MASNLEYIYRLKDQYSKKLSTIVKKQVQFTEAYTKSIGKANAASIKHREIIKQNARAYNQNNQAIGRVNRALVDLKTKQRDFGRQAISMMETLNSKVSKYNHLLNQAVSKQRKLTPRPGVVGGAGMAGGLAGFAGGMGSAMFAKSAFDVAVSFEKNLNAIKAVKDTIDIPTMRKHALDWGITTQFSAVQISGAMREAAQAGMEQNEILKMMTGNIALAAAGEMDLVEAMKLSTDVVNQFGRTVTNSQIADQLAAGASNSTSKVMELGAALKNAGTFAYQAGLNSKETIKLLMAVGETGLRGDIGGTFIANMLMRMKQMTPKLRKAFGKFLAGTGVEMGDLFNIQTGKFVKDGADKFSRLLITASDKQITALTTAYRMQGAKAVGSLAQLSLEKMAKFDKAMKESHGKALKMQETLMHGLPGGLVLFNSAVETTKLIMIEAFVTPLSEILRLFAKFLVYLSKNHKWVLTLAFAVISLTGAMYFLKLAIWAIGGAFTMWKGVILGMPGNIMAVVKGIKALTTAQWLFNAAAYANPYVLLTIAAIGLASAIGYNIYKTKKLGKEMEKINRIPNVDRTPYEAAEARNTMQMMGMLRYMGVEGAPGASTDTKSMMEQSSKAQDQSIGAKASEESKQSAQAKTSIPEQIIKVMGNIGVKASEGSEVEYSNFSFNPGQNMQGAF